MDQGIFDKTLQRCFTTAEWQHLTQSTTFQDSFAAAKPSLRDLETLIEIGDVILQEDGKKELQGNLAKNPQK